MQRTQYKGIWQKFKKLRDATCFKRNHASKFMTKHLKFIRGCCWSTPLSRCGLQGFAVEEASKKVYFFSQQSFMIKTIQFLISSVLSLPFSIHNKQINKFSEFRHSSFKLFPPPPLITQSSFLTLQIPYKDHIVFLQHNVKYRDLGRSYG